MATSARKSATPAWREFELLVARIEQALAGSKVVVKSPDRVPSFITRGKREVDASIRTKVGSAELLITVECRKRKSSQDVTWIEQLGSKKQAIGAARTIAVASSAFSADAMVAAAQYGIDLRVLSEVTDNEVQSWILPQAVVHVFKSCDLLESPEIAFDPEPGDDLSSLQSNAGGVDTKVFVGATGDPLSLNDLWLRADDQLKIFDKIPTDDKVHTLLLALQPSDSLHLRTPLGLRRVREIKMRMGLRWKHERILLGDAKVVVYAPASSSDSMVKQVRAEFESKEATSLNLRLGMQFAHGSDTATFTLETRPGRIQSDG